jgi:hypothetical protein
MPWIALAVVLAILIALLVARPLRSRHAGRRVAYERRRVLFTPAERSFFGVLELAVGNDFRLLGKVRLGDLLAPRKGLDKPAHQAALNKISRKHLDFVLCKPDDLTVLCAIELNDKSHHERSRQDRDDFLAAACQAAGLPLIFFDVQQACSPAEVAARIAEALSSRMPHRDEPVLQAPIPVNPFVIPDSELGPLCPQCSGLMVKRRAKGGESSGKDSWGCANFPRCRGVVTS